MMTPELIAAAGDALHALRDRGMRCATAESCTGGLIAAALTAHPGSSDVVIGGFVTYSNDMKRDILGVSGEDLMQFGAVSEQVARAMAIGVAGPGGGSVEKPVGLVWFGVADASGVSAHRINATGDRNDVRIAAAIFAFRRLSAGDHLVSSVIV